MQTSFPKSQPSPTQKVKNILIRSSSRGKFHHAVEHPERSYIMKYAPKYYKSLNIEITPFPPLLSKIKKIKKLKKLKGQTGSGFRKNLPQNLWFNLLANSRKEIEEIPEIMRGDFWAELNRSFWKRKSLQRIKHFPSVTRFLLESWRFGDPDFFLPLKELFAREILYLRRLKHLEIPVWDTNYEETKWAFEKLNGMTGFLKRLETLIISIKDHQNKTGKELFQNKNLCSHVTGLNLAGSFDPAFAEILNICKKLKSLSMNFCGGVEKTPEFGGLLTSIQYLNQLKSLKFNWPEGARDFWAHFKPQPSLRELILEFGVSQLVNEGLFGKNIKPDDPVGHWEEIQELDLLKFSITCNSPEEVIFVKQFSTMVLKKVRKLHSLKYYLTCPSKDDSPFSVEEVPHLYDSLKQFEYSLSGQSSSTVDLKMMKPFKNLKELKLGGIEVTYKNVEEAVALLEENQKEGEIPLLEIKSNRTDDEWDWDDPIWKWFLETLEKIAEIKRDDKNLKMLFEIRTNRVPFYNFFEMYICFCLQAVKDMNGLEVNSLLWDDEISRIEVDAYGALLKEMRNVRIVLGNPANGFIYTKVDGEKEQFESYI